MEQLPPAAVDALVRMLIMADHGLAPKLAAKAVSLAQRVGMPSPLPQPGEDEALALALNLLHAHTRSSGLNSAVYCSAMARLAPVVPDRALDAALAAAPMLASAAPAPQVWPALVALFARFPRVQLSQTAPQLIELFQGPLAAAAHPTKHAPLVVFYGLMLALLGGDGTSDSAAHFADDAVAWLSNKSNLTAGVDLKFLNVSLGKVLKVATLSLRALKDARAADVLLPLERLWGYAAKLEAKLKVAEPKFAGLLAVRLDMLLACVTAPADEPILARALALLRASSAATPEPSLLRCVAGGYAKIGTRAFSDGEYPAALALLSAGLDLLLEAAVPSGTPSVESLDPQAASSLAHIHFLLSHTERKRRNSDAAAGHVLAAVGFKAVSLLDSPASLSAPLPDSLLAAWRASTPAPDELIDLGQLLPEWFVASAPFSLVREVLAELTAANDLLWGAARKLLRDAMASSEDSVSHVALAELVLDDARATVLNSPESALDSLLEALVSLTSAADEAASHAGQTLLALGCSWVALWTLQFQIEPTPARQAAITSVGHTDGLGAPRMPFDLATSVWRALLAAPAGDSALALQSHLVHVADMLAFLGYPSLQVMVLNGALTLGAGARASVGLASAHNVLGDPRLALETLDGGTGDGADGVSEAGNAADDAAVYSGRGAVARSLALASLQQFDDSLAVLETADSSGADPVLEPLAEAARAALRVKVGEGSAALAAAAAALSKSTALLRSVEGASGSDTSMLDLPYDFVANLADTLHRLGSLSLAASHVRKAAYYFKKGAALGAKLGAAGVELRFRLEMVTLLASKHAFDEASAALDAVKALAANIPHSPHVELAITTRAAVLASSTRNWGDALSLYRSALDQVSALGGSGGELEGLVLEDTTVVVVGVFRGRLRRLMLTAQLAAGECELDPDAFRLSDAALPIDKLWVRLLAVEANADTSAARSHDSRVAAKRQARAGNLDATMSELVELANAARGCGEMVLCERIARWCAFLAPAAGAFAPSVADAVAASMSPSLGAEFGEPPSSGHDIVTLALSPQHELLLVVRQFADGRNAVVAGVPLPAGGEAGGIDTASVFRYQRASKTELASVYKAGARGVTTKPPKTGLTLEWVLERFGAIMLLSRATTSGAVAVSTKAGKAKWWKTRIALDKALGALLDAIQSQWLGSLGGDLDSVFGVDNGSTLVLVIDPLLAHLPWESLQLLAETACTRVPSTRFLAPRPERVARERAVFYLLNPSGDLVKTQARFEERFAAHEGWAGTAGAPPATADLAAGLRSANTYVYCGHGAGEDYFAMDHVLALKGTAPQHVLLLGCSSGLLRARGVHNPIGMASAYLQAGAARVVSNLWDVTDGDLDLLSDKLISLAVEGETPLEAALPIARAECKLSWLVASAAVVYGLPTPR
ncbi:uncharacterized protein AMSG_08713 [Thecamonas trahens ATCC 50062]|uniref:separase n=1 Tax=Thecamonas trahens ATCC 50062 TaxID=461836 RepID=A0A0L0DMI3_THETB|nr:hypothetical protein AMSG_08713 [Thecamonas trahens ATCC 50062]KNC53231.1 hypothetical protein AMSG_08713 [Thecamonas trahens ATCC 50062]|eukprot:XP_013754498.1 hypothetical protein AMSG_08713 [Thecamonas trahens ATCC 50062]